MDRRALVAPPLDAPHEAWEAYCQAYATYNTDN